MTVEAATATTVSTNRRTVHTFARIYLRPTEQTNPASAQSGYSATS
jgi:hypothetical protein